MNPHYLGISRRGVLTRSEVYGGLDGNPLAVVGGVLSAASEVYPNCLRLDAAGAVAEAAVPASPGRLLVTPDTRWLVYFGGRQAVFDSTGYRLLILDPLLADAENGGALTAAKKRGRVCVGYMSMGEAEDFRWYYDDIKDEPWVLSTNPAWPDSHLVDVREEAWGDLLVEEVAPRIFADGYDGLFLDNGDIGEILRDDFEYDGAVAAARALVGRIRAAFPDRTVIVNNGTETCQALGGTIDGMLFEGVRSTWNSDDPDGFVRRSAGEREWIMQRFGLLAAAGVPILGLDYCDLSDADELTWVYGGVAADGAAAFVSARALDWLPASYEQGRLGVGTYD
jgi:uncharacterized protein (TIGR01370 family)